MAYRLNARSLQLLSQTPVCLPPSPAIPQTPEDLTEDSTVLDAKTHHRKIILGWGTRYDRWHLSEHIIAFTTVAARANWQHFHDTKDLSTFAEALGEKIVKPPGEDSVMPDIRIIMCITWTESWVGKPMEHWESNPWHVWAIAIRPSTEFAKGKDCNTDIKHRNILEKDERANTTKLYKPDLLCMQFELLNFISTKRRVNIRRVYIGGHGNKGDGICFKLTGNWIRRMAATTTTCLPLTTSEAAAQGWFEMEWKNKPKTKVQEAEKLQKVTIRLNSAALASLRKRKADEAALEERPQRDI